MGSIATSASRCSQRPATSRSIAAPASFGSMSTEATSVTLYRSGAVEELFLPFRDATSGRATYGAGRYLDVERPAGDGLVFVDLNRAYNPNCAYNPAWSCPIPPGENRLPVSIRAGERTTAGVHEADEDS
jgi:uncharacterized protein (DUF1684 family)